METAIIKSNEPDNLDEPTEIIGLIYGRIRLWVEGTPPTPTQIWVIIGDFALGDSVRLVKIRQRDVATLNTKRDEVLAASKVTLQDYAATGRNFHMDIRVPQSIVDAYLT